MAVPVLADLTGQATDAELAAALVPGITLIVHGATAGTSRGTPSATIVLWIGSVTPTNAVNGDLWLNTA